MTNLNISLSISVGSVDECIQAILYAHGIDPDDSSSLSNFEREFSFSRSSLVISLQEYYMWRLKTGNSCWVRFDDLVPRVIYDLQAILYKNVPELSKK